MKKLLLAVCVLTQSFLYAQQATAPPHSPESLFREGLLYLKGANHSYDPAKAVQLFSTAAGSGHAASMNALGNMYASGLGVDNNVQTAIGWYTRAANAGYAKAWYNLGELYRTGTSVPQDFAVAANYYSHGARLGDRGSENWLAYLYYKGLGVTQSYDQALSLYQDLAQKGDRNAMYFLGKCYRNGYGTNADADLARVWLTKAAKAGEGQAIHELSAEPLPDNAFVYNPELREKIEGIRSHVEGFVPSDANDVSGSYAGYAIYYDFSGRYVLDMVPLSLIITKDRNVYQGTWKENDSVEASVKAVFSNNVFSFDNSSRYVRYNHYSNRAAEQYVFNDASLGIKYVNDSMYLSGDVRFYSESRKEPGEPMFVYLAKKVDMVPGADAVNSYKLSILPNPVTTQLTAHFSLTATSKIAFKLFDNAGNQLWTTEGESLPPGDYSHIFSMQGLAAGTYMLSISNGNTVQTKAIIKL